MSYYPIFPTEETPLILVLKNTHNQSRAKKIWHTITNNNFESRKEEIWESFAQLPKFQNSVPTQLRWSKPKCISAKNTSCAIILYSHSENLCTIKHILNFGKTQSVQELPQPLAEYKEFILNPTHAFLPDQQNWLRLKFRTWLKSEEFLQFEAQSQTYQTDNHFPTTVEDARHIVKIEEAPPPPTPFDPPTLLFVPQPTTQPILIPNLHAVNFRTGKLVANGGDCNVSLQIIEQGKTNNRREVFYAHPTAPSASNPQATPYPICPLKSTVAVLYVDINPTSQTFNQPIIKSINIANSTQEQIAAFLALHQQDLNPFQLAQFTQSPKLHPQPTQHQPQTHAQESHEVMFTPHLCNYCGNEFMPLRASSKFCSEQCRTIFYSHSRRKGSTQPQSLPQPQPPSNLVTQEQFAALSNQVAQLVQLLAPKD